MVAGGGIAAGLGCAPMCAGAAGGFAAKTANEHGAHANAAQRVPHLMTSKRISCSVLEMLTSRRFKWERCPHAQVPLRTTQSREAARVPKSGVRGAERRISVTDVGAI